MLERVCAMALRVGLKSTRKPPCHPQGGFLLCSRDSFRSERLVEFTLPEKHRAPLPDYGEIASIDHVVDCAACQTTIRSRRRCAVDEIGIQHSVTSDKNGVVLIVS